VTPEKNKGGPFVSEVNEAELPAIGQALGGEGPPDVNLCLVPTGSVGASASPPGNDGNLPVVARDDVAETPSTTPPAGESDYPLHAVATLFPLMSEEDFQALKEDIRLHGLIEPIWIYQGQLIDGRHRLRACRELGIKPRFQEWAGQGGSLLAFVLAKNAHRRHQTKSQLATVAVGLEQMLAQQAKERQRDHGGTAPGRKAQNTPGKNAGSVGGEAREQAAHLLGVSARYVSDAKRLKKKAPQVFDQVFSGEIELSQAMSQVFPTPAKKPKPTKVPGSIRPKSRGAGPGRDEKAVSAPAEECAGHDLDQRPPEDEPDPGASCQKAHPSRDGENGGGNGDAETDPPALLEEARCWTAADLRIRLDKVLAVAPVLAEVMSPRGEARMWWSAVSQLAAGLNQHEKERYADQLYAMGDAATSLALHLDRNCGKRPARSQDEQAKGAGTSP
jgi:hypothetical protein